MHKQEIIRQAQQRIADIKTELARLEHEKQGLILAFQHAATAQEQDTVKRRMETSMAAFDTLAQESETLVAKIKQLRKKKKIKLG